MVVILKKYGGGEVKKAIPVTGFRHRGSQMAVRLSALYPPGTILLFISVRG
jgi:hypothetical protein